MRMRLSFYALIAVLLFSVSCKKQEKEVADLILINGNIYTVDDSKPQAEALAISGDRILRVGSNSEIEALRGPETEVMDLEGQFVMPGFIEGHGHFSGLGQSLMYLNFLKSKSWNEIVQAVAEKAKTAKPGEWIIGRGWHQEKWTEPLDQNVLGYPYHDALSAVSPNNPVLLRHASGHGLMANAKAMELAGVTAETPNPSGGEIVRDSRGKAIGVFEERAMGVINQAFQEYLKTQSEEDRKNEWLKGIELAQEECLKKGVTSFQDAGSSFEEIDRYKALAETGQLNLRLWVMIRHSYDVMKDKLGGFPWINLGNHFLTVRGIKSELDGALGSFGAWLLAPYSDKKDFVGQNTTPVEEVARIATLAMEHDLQLCVHCIGDRANQEVLNVFEKEFQSHPEKKDLRWRIEHAQHLDTSDIPRFKQLGVIASMQAIHCTSDAPFVVKRLGPDRARYGAYPWRALLDAGAVVTNGTDTPVEDVDPIESLYATVTRKRPDSGQEFFPEQAMSRKEAIYSYTMACAYSAFEENDKGSLAPGKLADLIIVSKDLLNCTDEEILESEILLTMVGGQVKFKK
ncbi:MAG: amidohydrolase [Haliscomenobacter sp.]|nr:amidohydrolase [Haliscomenobacter sp.]